MQAWNLQLFEHINASTAVPHWQIAAAIAIAQWVICIVPVWFALSWFRVDAQGRRELLEVLAATVVALAIGQVIGIAWPQPRPFMVHTGTQFLAHAADPGFPSDHVTVLWSIACATLFTRSFARSGIVWFALGLLVGWSRVFLGVHFPLDVLGAAPVALAAATATRALREPLQPMYACAVRCWDRISSRACG
jgi:undecaprenyl-diphosphatase